jgi:predicted O-methyltransferase YrrM
MTWYRSSVCNREAALNADFQSALCVRIAKVLSAHDVDLGGYGALARLKLPGPEYLEVLRMLHLALEPKLYVEIGVRNGDSLHVASPSTRCIGIDPMPAGHVATMRPNLKLAVTTSDNFFANEAQRESARGFDLAFIDGDHSYEQALRDFQNLEAIARPHSVVALHDVIPMDAATAGPESRSMPFHSGEIWRLMATIVKNRSDLTAFTIACPPTGLSVVGRFGRSRSRVPFPHPPKSDEFPWMDWKEQCRMLNIVENDGTAIADAFKGRCPGDLGFDEFEEFGPWPESLRLEDLYP